MSAKKRGGHLALSTVVTPAVPAGPSSPAVRPYRLKTGWEPGQRDNEQTRFVLDGYRSDDGTRCELLVVHLVGGKGWCLLQHGWFGVLLGEADAQRLARRILGLGGDGE